MPPPNTQTLSEAEAATTGANVHPGEVIAGKFRVERILGEGGMGVVVAATHLQLREPVALKFLRREVMENAQVVARFAHEARAAAKLKSEHVARVLDVGEREDGTPFMVMEHLQGKDMGILIEQQERLPIAQAVECIIQACEGLAEAHARGIVHRDIKPENLFLVERDGWQCVKILDFGISKAALTAAATPEEIAELETSTIMGSPCYMSPEQLRSTEGVDHRADIWSLGAVLFELVTGKTPFDADQVLNDLIADILDDKPRSLIELRPDAPAGLEAVVQTCLQKDREKRYQTAAELAIALLQFAPRRARVAAERAVTVTRNAGLGDPSLTLPPSVFPSSPPSGPVPSIPSHGLSPAPVPVFDGDTQRTSRSSMGATSVAGFQLASSPPATKKRSFVAPLLGMGMAVVVLVGGVAVRHVMGPGATAAATVPAAPAAAGAATGTTAGANATPAPSATTAGAATATADEKADVAPLQIDTTPEGASVHEGAVEVCAQTPCAAKFAARAEAADAPHTITISKAGFRAETRKVHASDGELQIKLVKLGAGTGPARASDTAPTVQGFKDIPY